MTRVTIPTGVPTPQRQIAWSPALVEQVEAQLAKANGRRTTRLLTLADVQQCADDALLSELGMSWRHGGEAPDARELTTLCLCAVGEDVLTVGIAAAHGAATPASVWPDIPSWDRYREAPNAAASRAWARRGRDDRLPVPLGRPKRAPGATEDELRAAVLAAPEDDAPREVLADFLIERGDPRGEFIAVQCELARGSPRQLELEARELALLTTHGPKWLGGLGLDVLQVRFRRGFAHEVEVLDAQALPQLEGFFQREPVQSLRFVSSRLIDGARFAALGWLERLRALEFTTLRPHSPGALSLEQLGHLLSSRRLRGLRHLGLSGQRVRDEGLKLLVEQGPASLPGLESLGVERDTVTAVGAGALAGSKWAGRLGTLSLSDNELRAEGAAALADARGASRLVELRLGGNHLGNEGAAALARATRFGALEALWLPRNRIGIAGLEALLASPGLRGLKVLELSANPIGAAGRERLRARSLGGGV